MRHGVCCECGSGFEVATAKGPLPHRCPPCRESRKAERDRVKAARWRERNPDGARDAYNKYNRKRLADPEHLRWKRENELRRLYGIEPEEYAALLAEQDGVCAICGNSHVGPGKQLHVDHCHATGRVRGLLCAKCNTLLGLAADDVDLLTAAIDYLNP